MTLLGRAPALVPVLALAALSLGACGSDSAGTSADAGDSGRPAAQQSAVDDVSRLAPALESAVRGTDYPTDLAGAQRALEAADLQPSEGNVVAGYRYDPDAVEFTLCVQAPDGSYATYDTAPMAVRRSGGSGGCAAAGL